MQETTWEQIGVVGGRGWMLGAAGRLQETLVAAARRGPLECCEQMMGGEEARFE